MTSPHQQRDTILPFVFRLDDIFFFPKRQAAQPRPGWQGGAAQPSAAAWQPAQIYPDKEQGPGKLQAGFLFRCPSWQCRCDVLDSSWKGIIFECRAYCLWNSTWLCFSSLGALGNRHFCQYSFLFIWFIIKCEQTFGFVDVRRYIHALCLYLHRHAQAAAIFSLLPGSRACLGREAGGRQAAGRYRDLPSPASGKGLRRSLTSFQMHLVSLADLQRG